MSLDVIVTVKKKRLLGSFLDCDSRWKMKNASLHEKVDNYNYEKRYLL